MATVVAGGGGATAATLVLVSGAAAWDPSTPARASWRRASRSCRARPATERRAACVGVAVGIAADGVERLQLVGRRLAPRGVDRHVLRDALVERSLLRPESGSASPFASSWSAHRFSTSLKSSVDRTGDSAGSAGQLVVRRLAVARRRTCASRRRAMACSARRERPSVDRCSRARASAACRPTRRWRRRRRPRRRWRWAAPWCRPSACRRRARRRRGRRAARAAGSRSGRKIWPAPTNLNFTSPSSMTSPGSTMPRRRSAPLTRTPLLDPLSTISKRPSPSACTSQCSRDTELWLIEIARVFGAADGHALASRAGTRRRAWAREHDEPIAAGRAARRARALGACGMVCFGSLSPPPARRHVERATRPAGRCGSRRSGPGRRAPRSCACVMRRPLTKTPL